MNSTTALVLQALEPRAPFRCPWTDACQAQALAEFTPELAALFAGRERCGETDATRARRCAGMLGLHSETPPPEEGAA